MGVVSILSKTAAVSVAIVAIVVGIVSSGALTRTGIFRWQDSHVGERGGTLFKGMFPVHHEGIPWGFTHEEMAALDLTGETILVTGANVGLGYWTARHLAASGATTIIGCRSQKKCDEAANSIKVGPTQGLTQPTVAHAFLRFVSTRSHAAN
jgi:hypothetical protein